MGVFGQDGAAVEWRGRHETVRIEPWGADSLRARGTVRQSVRDDLPAALLPSPPPPGARTVITPDLARITSGRLTAEITAGGRLRFLHTSDGAELLDEVVPHWVGPPQRRYASTGPGSGLHHVEVLFGARDGERFYGLGQHQHGKLDQKGAVIELVQRNTEVSIPLLLSSLGYGFLWNHPGIGRAELGTSVARWVSEASRQWDYWITAADAPADIVRRYTDVTGRAPMLPDWASGFWQCKLWYRTQDELLDVAREYVWSKVREGYRKHGVRVWWLDACEPECRPEQPGNLRYHLGPGLKVGNIYPMLDAKGFYDGMAGQGETEVVSLCRSAWAGSQRYGAAVWSGDIDSTFEALRRQIPAGLNIGLSGIPWWTTDIGGFKGGDIDSPSFRELVVRWFQFGVFSPLCRLHGSRQPATMSGAEDTGAPNELWSFGAEAYEILRRWLRLRERLRPYVMGTMRVARTEGLPPMRPLFLNFPHDKACWDIADQFVLGDDLLVAPVITEGARDRGVYLPAGVGWRDAWTGELAPGGQWLVAQAPLARIPVYVRDGGSLAPFGDISATSDGT